MLMKGLADQFNYRDERHFETDAEQLSDGQVLGLPQVPCSGL